MGNYKDPAVRRAESGSRPVSQNQLRQRSTRAAPASGSAATNAARYLPVTIATVDWTADTTDYPDAPALGTLYRADINHNLGNDLAGVVWIKDAAGRNNPDLVLQFQTNEDPTTPGSRRPNHVRIWISSDAAPAVTLYALVEG
jgi:peptidoglycan/xylan/chitin deacetylase (PgdA/CDA1 family)